MAAPLSGVGQQIPLSQPFQPGGSDQTREIRQQNQEPRENETQVRGSAAAQSQQSKNSENGFNKLVKDNSSDNGSQTQQSSAPRGSVVDITA